MGILTNGTAPKAGAGASSLEVAQVNSPDTQKSPIAEVSRQTVASPVNPIKKRIQDIMADYDSDDSDSDVTLKTKTVPMETKKRRVIESDEEDW